MAAEKFAFLRRVSRIWAVGAIHGEAARLQALHSALASRFEPGDRIVYLGGFLGYGPDVLGTVDELLRFRRDVIAQPLVFASDVVFLRGQQEEMWHKLLQLQFAINPREVLDWMMAHGVRATLEAYGGDAARGMAAARDGAMSITRWTSALRSAVAARPGHQALLSALRRAAYSESGLLFVHAGVDPGRPLATQGDALWWGSAGFGQWPAPYDGFRRVVRGFDPAQGGLVQGPFTLSIDAGAGRGGPLLAVCIAADGTPIEQIQA